MTRPSVRRGIAWTSRFCLLALALAVEAAEGMAPTKVIVATNNSRQKDTKQWLSPDRTESQYVPSPLLSSEMRWLFGIPLPNPLGPSLLSRTDTVLWSLVGVGTVSETVSGHVPADVPGFHQHYPSWVSRYVVSGLSKLSAVES